MAALVTLAHKQGYTEAEAQKYFTAYRNLSFEELMAYKEIEIKEGLKDYSPEESAQLLQQDLAKMKAINQQSIEQFGEATNRITNQQLEELFQKIESKETSSANARVQQAGCPAVSFNASFITGGASSGFVPTFASRVDPGGKGDCDCQLAFATTNSAYDELRPRTLAATGLMRRFGDVVSGRRITGASAGTYPVFGTTRVFLQYGTSDCNRLLSEFLLTTD